MNHLTLKERVIIQYAIESESHLSLRQLSLQINKDPSTLYREIKHRSVSQRSKMELVQKSKAPLCLKKKNFPYVCNSCLKHLTCSKTITLYDAYTADEQARETLKKSRSKPYLNQKKMKVLNEWISPLIMNHQSLYHIRVSSQAMPVSESTLRRYIDKGYLDARNIDLPRTVRFPNKKANITKRKRINIHVLKDRTYQDYTDYQVGRRRVTLQLDTVIGKKEDKKCLLTLYEPYSKFQWAIIVHKSANSVNRAVSELIHLLKQQNQFFFDSILLDNGLEFSALPLLETEECGKRLFRVFYCDPYASFQKGGCERNHEFIRYVIKKGESFDFTTQDEINQLFSNINSLKRKSLGGRSPIQRFKEIHHFSPSEFCNVFEIPASQLKLKK